MFCRNFKNITLLEHWLFATHSNFEIIICLQPDGGMTLGYKHIGFVTKAQFLSSKMTAV